MKNLLIFNCGYSGQANWRKVKKLGFSIEYTENGKVRIFVWHILSMSYVPLGRHYGADVLLRAEFYEFEFDSNMSPSARRLFEML